MLGKDSDIMKIQTEVAVNGQVYCTEAAKLPKGMTLEDAARTLYDNIDKANSYISPLEDGGILVLGETALKGASFKFMEVSEWV